MSKIMKLFSPVVFLGFLVLMVQTEAYALTQRGLTADAIGSVATVDGFVEATDVQGKRTQLETGNRIFLGDILESGDDGAIGVMLADQSMFSMAENGRMIMDEMVYDPDTQQGNITIAVVQGVFTFVSGEVAKTGPEAMLVTTAVATIGIRGTQLGISYSSKKGLNTVLMKDASGYVGEIVVRNEAGVQVLNRANQGTTVVSATTAPAAPVIVPPESIVATFGKALTSMPKGAGVNTYGAEEVEEGSHEGLEDFETATGDLEDFETASGDLTSPDFTAPSAVSATAENPSVISASPSQ